MTVASGAKTVPNLDRLKAALSDRYAIERERAGGKALPKGLRCSQTTGTASRLPYSVEDSRFAILPWAVRKAEK